MIDKTTTLADRLPAELLAISEDRLATGAAAMDVLAALHTAANAARARAATDDAEALFRQILKHNSNDHNVRVALAEYAAARADYVTIESLLDPVYSILKADKGYGRAIAMLAEARLKSGRIADLGEMITGAAAVGGDDYRSQLLRERIGQLNFFGVDIATDSPDDPLQHSLRVCCTVFSEYEIYRTLTKVYESGRTAVKPNSVRTLLALVAICRMRRWWRPLKVCLALLDHSPATALLDLPSELWKYAGLPVPSVETLQARDANQTNAHSNHAAARAVFASAPTLNNARAVWHAASMLPMQMNGGGVTLPKTIGPARQDEEDRLARLWYMVTWHEGADRLLRLVSMLSAPHVNIVVSVGGAIIPVEIEKLTSLLLVDQLQILFRPVVTWGGQKLLLQNTYSVMQAFLNNQGEWLHVICNRSFPLMGPREAGKLLAGGDFIHRFPGVAGPPAWHGEWSDDVVEKLDEIYDTAIGEIFSTADTTSFSHLANASHKLNSSVFNFSSRAEVLEKNFKDNSHGYCVSPFGTDMRWMSFSRLGEFVDVSAETGRTFTRRLSPLIAKWVHGVIRRNELRTGDPFVLMSRRYAEVALNDPNALELYAAMNLGFAPEMNFFDTVAMTERFGLREEMAHTYFRNDQQEARNEDVLQASIAADVDRNMFMRKTWPDISNEFVRNFADKVGSEWPQDSLFLVASVGRVKDTVIVPSPRQLLHRIIFSCSLHLRTLIGEDIGDVSLTEDFTMLMAGLAIGSWCWDEETLVLTFLDGGRGTKRYERATSDSNNLILVPAELVSARNAWSVFIEIALSDIEQRLRTDDHIATACLHPDLAGVEWRASRSATAALLDAMVVTDHADYRVPVSRPATTLIEARGDDVGMLTLCTVEGEPALLTVDQVAMVRGRTLLLMQQAEHPDQDRWEAASRGELETNLVRQDLAGCYDLVLMVETVQIEFRPDGTIAGADGHVAGMWVANDGVAWIVGHPKLRFAAASQFQRLQSGRWRLSGWGWANIEDRVTFVISPR